MDEIIKVIQDASAILDRIAGVTDSDGTVIACTNQSRVGSVDKLASEIFASDDQMAVTGKTSYRKILVDNSPEYMCFIEGTDQNAQTYLELLSNWLIAALRDGNKDSDRDDLIKNVLLENELPGDIPLKAREYRIPYAALRVVFLIQVSEETSMESLEVMRSLYPNRKMDYVLAMDEEHIVLVKEFYRDELDQVDSMARDILETLNSESLTHVSIGIGMPAETLRDCAKSYREASLAMTIGGIFQPGEDIIRYDNLGLGRLIYQLPPTLCHMFLDEVFPEGSYESLDSETLVTIEKFFENNLNGSETSRQLFVHRNTLVYRLDKVQKITKLDLRTFDDAVLFKLASMVRQYLEFLEKDSTNSTNNKWWRS